MENAASLGFGERDDALDDGGSANGFAGQCRNGKPSPEVDDRDGRLKPNGPDSGSTGYRMRASTSRQLTCDRQRDAF
jgi:hypothetical protein